MDFGQDIMAWITVLLVKKSFFCAFFASINFSCYFSFFSIKYIVNFAFILESGLLLDDAFLLYDMTI